jgi:hypothetical protein
MKIRCLLVLLFSATLVSTSFGEDVDSRLNALEDRSSVQERIIEEQQKTIETLRSATRTDLSSRQAGGGRLRLLDLPTAPLIIASLSIAFFFLLVIRAWRGGAVG